MSTVSDEAKQKLALSLHKFDILKFGQFTLKSGIIAPFYIDLRTAQSHPEAFHNITAVYAQMVADLPIEVFLAGIPEAGIPIASAVGYATNRPLVQPRAKIKSHGMGKTIEGDWKPGDKVAIIDDLVTKGDSKIEALTQFKNAELEVTGFYLLFDREMGGKELVEKAGYSVDIAMTITEALYILRDNGKLESAKYDEMVAFIRQG
jgi:uridine monophosphate synthetase